MPKNNLLVVVFVIFVIGVGLAFYNAIDLGDSSIDLEDETAEIQQNPARVPKRTPIPKQPPVEVKPSQPTTKKTKIAEPKANDDVADLTEIHVSVLGRAIDTEGNPVVGANIELISVNGQSQKIARTLSDDEGYFDFGDQVVPPQSKGGEGGTINLFGTAAGFGFAWHGMRGVNLKSRPAKDVLNNAVERTYYRGEECVMNLVFGRAQNVKGIIVDEKDVPVPDVEVKLISCDFIDKKGKHSHVNYREFWGLSHLPPSTLMQNTDGNGQFKFYDLPPECVFTVSLKHPERSNRFAFFVTTNRDIAKLDIKPNVSDAKNANIQKSPMRIRMPSTRALKVLCIHPWSKAPIAAARVLVYRNGKNRQSSSGTTNAQGEVDLKLPPGKFKVSIDPPTDAELIRTRREIEVFVSPLEQQAEITLDAAAIVILEAVEAQTGKPLAGVSFNQQDSKGRTTQVQENLSYVSNPKTGEDGLLKVLMRPGKTILSLGWSIPQGYQSRHDPKQVELEGGKQTTVRFELKKSQ